jgi:hypothetical protein
MARNPAHQTPVNILDVPSVSEYSEGVEAGSGQIVMPKMTIPGVGCVAYCRDLAGNVFGIFQGDEGRLSGSTNPARRRMATEVPRDTRCGPVRRPPPVIARGSYICAPLEIRKLIIA